MKISLLILHLALGILFSLPLEAQVEFNLTSPLGSSPYHSPSADQTLLADSSPIHAQDKLAAADRYLADHLHEAMDPLPDPDYEKLHSGRDAIRELIQAGYDATTELAKRSATYQAELRDQMLEKYSEHAGDLLRMMGEI